MMKNTVTDTVQKYYGKVLKTSQDLKTNACCTTDAMPLHLHPFLANIHKEVQSKCYGCGSPIPPAIKGLTVLDLGCGAGRDLYIASQLVGESGAVIGVDMTTNQIAVAKKHISYHMEKFGFKRPNVTLYQGYMEDLQSLGIKDNSLDVVISNCVMNLSPNKEAVFREIFRVLKPGGELYFSDVFADRRVPDSVSQDPLLLGECLGGAMYIEDFRRMLRDINYPDYRIVSKQKITLNDKEVQLKAGMIDFYALTIRTFKCDFEDTPEDYGHVARYRGTIADNPHGFCLDNRHFFRTGQPVPVCGNTAKMLTESRYSEHFTVMGDFSRHFGAFGRSLARPKETMQKGGCC